MIVEAASSFGEVVTFITSVLDLVDGSLTPICTPPSGSLFAIGDTTVSCTATDAHLNIGINSFTVTISDTTAPTVTVPSDITIEATGPSGEVVTFTASASDLVDGSLTPICAPPSGSIFAIGDTTVSCDASDVHSNIGNDSFMVTVQDTTAPVVIVPSDMTVEATGPSGAVVNFTALAI